MSIAALKMLVYLRLPLVLHSNTSGPSYLSKNKSAAPNMRTATKVLSLVVVAVS